MKIALIGASGFIGTRVLSEALERGHNVTGIVRNPARLPNHERLVGVSADIQAASEVAGAVAGHDVVVSCFHPGGHDPSANRELYRDIVEGTWSIIRGVRDSGVSRLVYVGGCGSLDVRPGVMLVDDPAALAAGFTRDRPLGTYPEPASGAHALDIPRAARVAYLLFERERELDWSFLSPSRFIGDFGGPTGRIRLGGGALLRESDGSASRVDVADLAIAVLDEVETPQHSRAHFTVASRTGDEE